MATLDRVGVTVRRTNPRVTQPVVEPVMKLWLVGPCFELLDLYDNNGALNSDAVLSTPAKLVGTEDISSNEAMVALRNKKFVVRVDGGAPQTVTFPSNLTTQGRMLTELNSQTTGLRFTLESNKYLSITTSSSGDGSSIRIGDGAVNTVFGFTEGQFAEGYTRYKNRRVSAPFSSFPAPRGNIASLSFSGLTDRIRAFYVQAGQVREFERTTSLLRNAYRPELVTIDAVAGANVIGSPLVDSDPENPDVVSRNNYVSRGLVALDDGDGDSTTRKVYSPGNRATFTGTYHNAAMTVIPKADTTDNVAFLVLEGKVSAAVPGWRTAYIRYASVRGGAGIDHSFAVSGLGTSASPWTITHTFPTGATYAQVAAAIVSATTTVPNSGGLGVKDILSASVSGDGSAEFPQVTATALGNFLAGRSGQLVCAMKDAYYGSLGSAYLLKLTASESAPADVVTLSGSVFSVNYQVLPATLGGYNVSGEPNGYEADNHVLKASASSKLPGALGEKLVYKAVPGDGLATVVDFDYAADGSIARVTIKQTYEVDVTTYAELLADLMNENLPAAWLLQDVSIEGAPGTVGAGWETGPDGVTFEGSVGPMTVNEAAAALSSDSDSSDVMTAAASSGNYSGDALLPLAGADQAWFSGGWDPVDFRDVTSDVTGTYTHGVVVGSVEHTGPITLDGLNLQLRFCGMETYDIQFTTEASLANVVDTINAAVGYAVASASGGKLKISSQEIAMALGDYGRRGLDSYLEILGGTAVEPLFGTQDFIGTYHGAALALMPGDRLYDSGQYIGTVVAVEDFSVGGNTYPNSILILDREVSISASYSNWYVRAQSLDFETDTDRARPLPELTVDETNGLVVLKGNVALNSNGVPMAAPSFQMYVSYKALRTDLADGITITNEAGLSLVSPLTVENPLGLALQQAFVIGNGIRVYGYGVTAVSDDEPEGTYSAYLQARQFLRRQGKNAYVIVPLTSSHAVIDMLNAYADDMCKETARVGGQIVISAPALPKYGAPTALATGTAELVEDGAKQYIRFDPASVDLQAVLAAEGITGDDLEDEDVFFKRKIYVDITSDPKHYLVKVADVRNNRVEIHVNDAYWQDNEGNEDGFFAKTPVEFMEADGEACSLLKRGEEIDTSDPDAYGEALAAYAQKKASIGVRIVGPDDVQMIVDGIPSRVPGYYAAAGIGAIVSTRRPSRPMHNLVMPLVTKVFWPDGFDDRAQAIAAGGGYSLLVQDTDGLVRLRDFITTKVDSVEDREHTMVIVDHVAERIIREVAEPLVGQNEIDDGLLTELSFRLQQACMFMVERGVYRQAEIQDVYQNEDNPTQVVVELARVRKYPLREVLVILL